jgi:hypothetical protein
MEALDLLVLDYTFEYSLSKERTTTDIVHYGVEAKHEGQTCGNPSSRAD